MTVKGRVTRGWVSAALTGYGQGMLFWVYGTVFYLGAILVDDGTLSPVEFFTAFFAVVFGAYGVGKVRGIRLGSFEVFPR